MQVLHLLWGTVLLRPYVFIFLLVYLACAVPAWGWRRTGIYTILGYGLAWLAEFSSIHTGFPFGPYSYISGSTLHRELWIAGVPFMDSLSFVFLTFAGLQTARLITGSLAPGPLGRWDLRWAAPGELPGWGTWILAGLLTMGLDVIIDPVALRGEHWFLGQIYNYPEGGIYFGVPLANFAGWALVAWAVTGIFLLLERWRFVRVLGAWRGYPADALPGLALFAGVLAFNLVVTFAIGEFVLGLVGFLLAVGMGLPAFSKLIRALSPETRQQHAPTISDAG